MLGLGVEDHIPLFQGDIHRWIKEGGDFRPVIAHKDIQRPELGLDPVEQTADLVRLRNVCLDKEPLGPSRPGVRQSVVGRRPVLVIVNGDSGPQLVQL